MKQEAVLVDGLHICHICGDVACGAVCPSCEEMADRYDTRYHAHRAAELFGGLPRVQPNVLIDDGLGAMRGAAVALKWTTIAAVASFCFGMLVRWMTS